MLTGQYLYLIIFLTLSILFYYIIPKHYRYLVLLFFSICFAICVSYYMSIFILLAGVVTYFFGKLIDTKNAQLACFKSKLPKEEYKEKKYLINKQKKKNLILALASLLIMLLGVKYLNFIDQLVNQMIHLFNPNLSIPTFTFIKTIGISYYSLTSIGYLVDVYRGKFKCERNFFKLLLFISYFPALIEGPFARYDKQGLELNEGNSFDFNSFVHGFFIALYGLMKKMIVADRLSPFVSEIFTNYSQYNGLMIVLGALAFTAQLYFDFSGIINFVTGCSEMMGIHLEENFKYPFFSISVGEFWRRWHISLGAWFKDYVFYPMSMSSCMKFINRRIKKHTSQNFSLLISSGIVLFVVWVLTGLWHGASGKYIVYGIYYFIIIFLETIDNQFFMNFKSHHKVFYTMIGWIKTFVLVNIGMLLFKADNISLFILLLKKIFIFSDGSQLFKILSQPDFFIVMIGIIFTTAISMLGYLHIDIIQKIRKYPMVSYIILLVMVTLILLYGLYGEGYQGIDPIYGDF